MDRSRLLRLLLFSAGVVVSFVLVGGCAAADPEPAPTPTPVSGHLVGHVYSKGGRDPKSYPYPATLTATAIHTSVKAVHDFAAASDGSFGVDLPPGQYTITGMLISAGTGLRTSPLDVVVRAGVTTEVDLYSIHP